MIWRTKTRGESSGAESDVEHSSESDCTGGGFSDSEMRGGRVATREEGGGARDTEDFSLDPSRADDFVEVIETMLRDSTPFVLSSAIAAFQEVCPHRIDLLHRHYRKLARILVDIDEWGQMLTCELLLRYARTQFLPPDGFNRELNVGKDNENNEEMLDIAGFNELNGSGGGTSGYDRHDTGGTKGILAQAANFYDDDDEEDSSDDSSSSSDSDDSDSGDKKKKKKNSKASKKRGPVNQGPEFLDDHHRLLLRCTRPLLQSQNAGVVLAVASLHFYLAPIADVPRAMRALVFAARTKPECQHVLLKNAVAMAKCATSLLPFAL